MHTMIVTMSEKGRETEERKRENMATIATERTVNERTEENGKVRARVTNG